MTRTLRVRVDTVSPARERYAVDMGTWTDAVRTDEGLRRLAERLLQPAEVDRARADAALRTTAQLAAVPDVLRAAGLYPASWQQLLVEHAAPCGKCRGLGALPTDMCRDCYDQPWLQHRGYTKTLAYPPSRAAAVSIAANAEALSWATERALAFCSEPPASVIVRSVPRDAAAVVVAKSTGLKVHTSPAGWVVGTFVDDAKHDGAVFRALKARAQPSGYRPPSVIQSFGSVVAKIRARPADDPDLPANERFLEIVERGFFVDAVFWRRTPPKETCHVVLMVPEAVAPARRA